MTGGPRRFWARAAVVAVTAAAGLGLGLPSVAEAVSPLLGADAATLTRQPQITPQQLGSDPLTGLQYADPTEHVDTVAAPSASSQGNAQLSLPLTIPAGRGGVQPDLTVHYDSSASDGWLGVGWNLDVGSIEVDPRWGVPRYSTKYETETYQLNGAGLSPTAVTDHFQPRVKDRADFTVRVDTGAELIIRHGDSPKNYWWEVRDKNGDVFWYGGKPDLGGPYGKRPAGETSGLDPKAVLTDDQGNIYRWALSAQRDVAVNMIRYSYETVAGQRVGAGAATLGRQMYLKDILYTCASAASKHPEDPAYEVRLLRDSAITPRPSPRSDVVIDGRGGFLQVTSDLLRRVEVWSGPPNADESQRTFNVLSRAFDFNYRTGAFGKTLLASVDQVGSDGKTYATKRFGYFNDVQRSDGSYDGFSPSQDWSSGGQDIGGHLLGPVGLSALGASETTGFSAHAYLGFSPTGPDKDTSAGGALSVSGDLTQALAEMLDINGDGLPDKVYRRASGVYYRLNGSGPHGGSTFGAEHQVANLGSLSSDFGIDLGGGPEAYIGASVQFNLAAGFSVGTAYFEDVNNDGLPDFVSGGTVSFDHLDANGTPTFTPDSSQTPVPLGSGSALALPHIQGLDDVAQKQRDQSPLMDTVRRWVAPFAGTVSIDAPVSFDPPPADPNAPGSADTDGVRVTIQRGNTELWAARLAAAGDHASPSGLDAVTVSRGQAVYFRVQSVDSGSRDQVSWAPKVSYTSYAHTSDTPVADVNGLSQSTFDGGADFTLAGRPNTQIVMPLAGTVHFAGVLHKFKPTTDDVEVLVLRNGVPVIDRKIAADTVSTNGIDVSGDFAVAAPSGGAQDKVTVKLAVDSPIDVSALAWTPRLYYTAASRAGQPVPTTDPRNGQPVIELAVPADTDIYPNNNLAAPATPWVSSVDGPATVHAEVVTSGASGGGEVFLTVKQRGVLVGKAQLVNGVADLDVTLHQGQDYWFDLTVRDSATSRLNEQITSESVELRGAASQPVPHTLNWNGHQGIFPIAYRGWGYAGYNGDGSRAALPIDEGAFVFRPADFPSSNPHGFGDSAYKNPIQGDSYPFVPYQLSLKNAGGDVTGTAPVWRGIKDDTVGGADFARSSRKGVDDPGAITRAVGSAGAHAVPRLGIAAPTFGINASLGPVSGSFALGPSFGLLDQIDLNGDGFPDVVAPGSVQYTGPRGAYFDSGSGPAVVDQNSTVTVGVGFNGSAAKVHSSPKGTTNGTAESGTHKSGGSAADKGGEASKDQYGLTVGGQIGITAEFTNPGAAGSDVNSLISQVPATPTAEQHYADVNGDGLPDLVKVASDGVYVNLNLGYGFGPQIKWSDGGFQAGESYAGSIGTPLGFQANHKEFAGGLSLNESVDFPRYAWIDVNGDGIPDRLRKDSTDNEVYVAFGTGAGVMGEVDYGHLADGSFNLTGNIAINGNAGIPTGQQIAEDRSQSLGGAFDFTIPIPVCPDFQCYILVNPGVDADQSFSSSQIQLADINGDGYPDSLSSASDNTVAVRLNRVGRTNLLASVTNSLGGQIRIDYQREGNTPAQPASQWALSSVQTDDGRPGDGVNTLLSTYTYAGGNYSRLERQQLGYSTVTEYQRAYQGDGNVYDDPVVRSIVRAYRNATVFDSGLITSEQLRRPDGTPIKETRTDWQVVNLADDQPLDLSPPSGDPANTRLLGIAGAPERTKVEQLWYDSAGAVGERTWNTFEYDDLGNVVKQVDVGQPEDPKDDLTALTTFSNCDISASADLRGQFGGCPAPTPAGRLSPLWNAHRCPTWTSLPAKFEILDAAGHVLRSRDGSPALCDNGSVTDLKESIGHGEVAETNLSYDDWGSYNHIAYPANAGGQRRVVDYVYDRNSHANVAQVDDSHGLRATATFDGRTGRIASRTDVNGQTTSYGYDQAGRLASITGPYEQGTGHPTASFEYFPTAAGYAYALAHNYDAFNPSDTIDTATFVDGSGRTTQTKQDATVFRGANSPAANVMVVSGAGEFDALGRPVKQWQPTEEPLGKAGSFNDGHAVTGPAVTTWNLSDQVTNVRNLAGKNTATAHEFGGQADFGASLFATTVTDANGKRVRTYTDVHDSVRGVDDLPVAAAPMRTRYEYDGLGELTGVTDNGGNLTTHTYNLLGERTSTKTPDAGLVEYNLDGASNLVSRVTPNLRAAGQQINYRYDVDRLTGVDYPGGASVRYAYGTPGSGGPANGVGRVITVQDGARDQHLTYDRLGQVAGDTTTMLVHNLNDATGQRNTYSTGFTYDGFGRMRTVTYPDGEVVTNGYDAGGLLNKVSGVKAGTSYGYLDRLEYDEFFDHRFQRTANGVQTVYTYDPLTRRVARQATDTPTRRIQDLNYSYDDVGNVVKLDDPLPPPTPSLYGGPLTQNYHYDPYYRLSGADGTYAFAANKHRDYTYSAAYDVNGNLIAKSQTDVITTPGGSTVTQHPTTYALSPISYSATKPHQIAKIGTLSYSYDANGNFTGWTDDKSGRRRTVTWDAADRMRSVADQGSTTSYTYDAAGALALQRGPSGETAFVNPWYTVRNGTEQTKEIWAGNDRLASQRAFDGGAAETMRYFLHKDLQGSTNVVTDNGGLAFQHLEWFPSGEPWIVEQSTDSRTPYQYTGGYLDDTRNLTNLGARWYEPREQFLYAPDPVLTDDPAQAINDPAVLAAYSYADSDPLRFVDLSGRSTSAARAAFAAAFGAMRRPAAPGLQPLGALPARAALAAALLPAVRALGGAGAGAAGPPAAPVGEAAPPPAAPAGEESDSRLEQTKDLLEAKPLFDVKFTRTENGFSLESVKVSPTFSIKAFRAPFLGESKAAEEKAPEAAKQKAPEAAKEKVPESAPVKTP